MLYPLNLGPVGRGIEHGCAARVRAPGAPGLAHADVRRRLTWAVLRLATRTAPEGREEPLQKTATATIRPCRHSGTVHPRSWPACKRFGAYRTGGGLAAETSSRHNRLLAVR